MMVLPVALQTERIGRVILHSLPKFLPKENVYRMRCWMVQESLLLWTRPLDPDSVASVIRIRIANMYPITKKIIKCSNLKDQNFLSGGLEAFP